MSYVRNPDTGSIEILDRNDYFPFGMNMYQQNSVYDASGTPLNNKYNQKELQETGFYDYGWRQYMPDLGRWFGMDQLSEKFHTASPYAYVMNNPIMMYDPDGRVSMDWINSFYNNSQNGYNTTWTNTGSGFSNNWGGMMDYGANPTNFGSIFAGGMSGGGEAYIRIPEVVLSGQGNTKTWNRMANYEANMNSLYNGISGVSSGIFHSFNPFFGKNAPEPGGGSVMMMGGDMFGFSDLAGMAISSMKPQNRYAAYGLGILAIGVSRGRATDDILRGELAAEKASIYINKHGNLTDDVFTISTEAMKKHKFDLGIGGKSIFYPSINADEAVLKAAQYAEQNGLWIYNGGTKAKVTVTNSTVGVLSNGQATNVINVYKTANNIIHGAPGTPK